MTIGEALRAERNNLHYKQKQMVANTSISVSHYSKIENGMQEIKAKDLFELLDARQIDIVNFKNKLTNVKKENITKLADQLTKAFYKPDIVLAKKVRNQIDMFSNEEELQIRAELVVAVLTNDLQKSKKKLSSKLVHYFESNQNWVSNQDMLRIIGNSTRVIDFNLLATLMDKLFIKYKNINQYPLDVQKRVSNIFINYLHVLYDYQAKIVAQKYIIFLKELPGIPELIFGKLIGNYYDAVFSEDKNEIKKVTSILNELIPKVLNGLPEK